MAEGIFNYDFAHSRCDMYNTFLDCIDKYDKKHGNASYEEPNLTMKL